MKILALDTTTLSGSVALLEKARLLAEINLDSSLTHSERLLASIDFLLQTNKLSLKDMDGFALASGPGSFTGIRIGLSTVKSFSFASGKLIAPVSSLKALALKLIRPQVRLLCPMIDAKKGEIYAALFESTGTLLKEIIPQGVYTPDRFFSLLPSHRVIYFIGNGIAVYKNRILDYLKDKAKFSSRSLFIAHEVGLLGFELLETGSGVSYQELEPIYFRKSQAEEKSGKGHAG